MTVGNYGPENMIPGFKAAVDLSAKQYRSVKVTAAGVVNVAGGATGELHAGILVNKPELGDPAEIVSPGAPSVPIKLAGTVALMGEIRNDANGDGVAATTAGDIVIGICIQAGVTGDLSRMIPAQYRKHA